MAGKSDLQITVGVVDQASGKFKEIGSSGKAASAEIAQGVMSAVQALNQLQTEINESRSAVQQATASMKTLGTSGMAAAQQLTQGTTSAVASLMKLGQQADQSTGVLSRTASQFDEVGDAATDMARDLDKAADQGKRAAAEIEQAAKATSTTSTRSFREIASSAKTEFAIAGGAFAVLGGQLAQSTRDQALSLQALDRLYGTNSTAAKDFAKALQESSKFSDDAARSAEILAGSLTSPAYRLAFDQAQNLVSISADLATVFGTDLQTATEAVTSSLRGEAEMIERFGINLSQTAVAAWAASKGFGDFNKITDQATQAQIRYAYLLEQTAKFQGAAGEYAETAAGRTQIYINKLKDIAQSGIAASGPVGEIAAALADTGSTGIIAATGLASAGKALFGVVKEAGGLKAALSSAATFIGPGGLVVAGLGLAAIAAVALSDSLGGDNLYGKIEKVIEGGKQLDLTIASLTSTMTDAVLGSDILQGGQFLEGLRSAWETMQGQLVGGWDVGFTGGSPDEYQAYLDAMGLNQQLIDSYGSVELALEALGIAQSNYETILRHQGAGQTEIMARLQEMIRDVQRGFTDTGEAYSTIDFFNDLQFINDNLGVYDARGQSAAASTQELAAAISLLSAKMSDELVMAIAELIDQDAPQEYVDRWLKALPELQLVMDFLSRFLSGEELDQTGSNIAKIIASGNDKAIAELERFQHEVQQGYLSPEDFAIQVDLLANDRLPTYAAEAKVLANALGRDLNPNLGETARVGGDVANVLGTVATRMSTAAGEAGKYEKSIYAVNDAAKAALKLAAEQVNEVDGTKEALKDLAWRTTTVEIADQKAARAAEGHKQARQEQKQALLDYLAAAQQAADQLGLLSTDAQKFQLAGVDTPALDVAVNLQVSQSSLDDVNRVIVGNTNQLSQQMGGIKSWADELIGDPGVWAEMDRLLADNRISQEEYDAAQEAQISISRDVANAQEDILAIQTKLAPVIAEVTRQQAEYIDSLQDQDQQSQLAALGYMDQAESSKAMQLAQLAAMSTTDEMRQSTELMIQQMAASDPVLKAMLIDMGLLNEQDGTVNFSSNAVDVGSAVEELTKSIDRLIERLGGTPPLHIDAGDLAPAKDEVDSLAAALAQVGDTTAEPDVSVQDDASEPMSFIQGGLDGIDSFVANPVVTVEDYATGQLLAIAGQLAALDTKKVTTYVETVYQTRGEIFAGPAADGTTIHAFSNGGTLANATFIDVPQYMTGGSHAIVGERGPELVWLPNGSQVTNTEGTRSRLQQDAKRGRRAGDLINRGTIIVQPASSDIEPAVRRKLLAGWRG